MERLRSMSPLYEDFIKNQDEKRRIRNESGIEYSEKLWTILLIQETLEKLRMPAALEQ